MLNLDKQESLSVFNRVFEEIRDLYPFKNKKAFLDFEKIYLRYRQRLVSLDTSVDFFIFLKDFLANLKNSHTKLGNYPGKNFYQPNGYSVVFVSDGYFLKKGVNILGRIITVNGRLPEVVIKEKIKKVVASTKQYAFVQGLKIFLGDTKPGSVVIKIESGNNFSIKKLFLRPAKFKLINKNLESKLIGKIGYLKIKSWTGQSLSDDLEKKIEFFNKKKIKSLIIDVRDNSGGNSDLAKKFSAHFFNKKVFFGTVLERKSKEDFQLVKRKLFVEPSLPYYGWPIYVLISPTCLSSNEYFIGGLKDNKRATLIGSPTGGGSGNPKKITIQFGASNFELFISSWIFYRANEVLLEGKGIKPDIIVSEKISDIENGRDEVLEKTIRLLKHDL